MTTIDPTLAARLSAALLSDALDEAGARFQACGPELRPLDDSLRLLGRARTAVYRESVGVQPGVNPYALEIALIDDLKPGEVAVLAVGGSRRIAPWGSLLTTAALARGSTGCVTDGFVRDVLGIRAKRFAVFHGGIAPLDSKGRGEVAAIDVPVTVSGVVIAPGDLLFGDADGLVAIPAALEAEVLAQAARKLAAEDGTLAELEAGALLADVFRRWGVL